MLWHKYILPVNTNGPTWIHQSISKPNTRKNNSIICTKEDFIQWIYLFRYQKFMCVLPQAGKIANCCITKKPRTTHLPSMPTHRSIMEEQKATSHVFIGSWQFWCQICRKATCGSSHKIHQKTLYHWCILDWWTVLYHLTRLETWTSKK